jgi:hypothetical protein
MPAFNTAATLNPGHAAGVQSYFAQIRQSFSELGSALDSGDLAGALVAFSPLSLLTKFTAANDAGPAPKNGKPNGGNPNQFCADLAAIGRALNVGDLSAARETFSKLQRTIRPVGTERLYNRSFGA